MFFEPLQLRPECQCADLRPRKCPACIAWDAEQKLLDSPLKPARRLRSLAPSSLPATHAQIVGWLASGESLKTIAMWQGVTTGRLARYLRRTGEYTSVQIEQRDRIRSLAPIILAASQGGKTIKSLIEEHQMSRAAIRKILRGAR